LRFVATGVLGGFTTSAFRWMSRCCGRGGSRPGAYLRRGSVFAAILALFLGFVARKKPRLMLLRPIGNG
jgi:hypothetical protein